MRKPQGVSYFRDVEEAETFRGRIKQAPCPHCGVVGLLICWGYLMGYRDADDKRSRRGCRFCCNNRRGRRKGCGATFSVLFADALRRRQVSAPCLFSFILLVLSGLCRRAAWAELKAPFSLQHAYRLWHALERRQMALCEMLCRLREPPESSREAPLFQTLEHLSCAFPQALCPISAFQRHFQSGFLG
jgi:hypothetical protein